MKIFLSAPLTQFVGSNESLPEFATVWTSLTTELEGAGHSVFSAHRREAWGARLNTPAEALEADLAGLREADLVIAYIGAPWSPGVQLEIGFSLALERRMIVFAERGQMLPYLTRGLPDVADVTLIEIDSLSEMIMRVKGAGLTLPAPDTPAASA